MKSLLSELRSYLQKPSNHPGKGKEVEARIVVTKPQFFTTLQEYNYDNVPSEYYRDDLFASNLRRRRVYSEVPSASSKAIVEEWMVKKSVSSPYDSEDFGVRVAVATETVASALPPAAAAKPNSTRTSLRWSLLQEEGIRLDFIEDTTEAAITEYRIEAELLPTGTVDVLLDWIPRLLSSVQSSHIPISFNEKACVIQAYNSLVEGKSAATVNGICTGEKTAPPSTQTQRFLRGSFPHPEDLTLDELANGAMWAGGTTSTLTVKADGEITELLFLKSGIYAVSGQDIINKLLDNSIAPLLPSMYQGEMVEPYPSSGITSSYTFVMFETLYVKGIPVRNITSFADRREKQKPLLSLFGRDKRNPTLTILLKPFPVVKDADSFYSASNTLIDLLEMSEDIAAEEGEFTDDDIMYKNDGLIGTQDGKPYVRGDIKIWKLKERKNLTIDLAVQKEGLMVQDDRPGNKGQVLFAGNSRQGFTMSKERVEKMVGAVDGMRYGEIWEFAFDESGDNDFKVVPIRPRLRKDSPNKWTTAQNIWKLILSPLSYTTVRGKDLVLMRRYHNNVKRELFASLKDSSTLLDLGSGRGGDIGKMRDKKLKAYLLEPFAENREELMRRVQQNGWQSTLQAGVSAYGAEESNRVKNELLKGKEVDAVSMMLILTFFFKNEALLTSLVDTISSSLKEGGTLLLLTFDGERVKAGMRGAGKMTGPMFSLERKKGNEVLVSLGEESIVVDQTEWLTDLVTFDDMLAVHNIVPIRTFHLTDTANFPRPQRLLSAMYTAVVYERKTKEDTSTGPINPVIDYELDELEPDETEKEEEAVEEVLQEDDVATSEEDEEKDTTYSESIVEEQPVAASEDLFDVLDQL